MARPSTTTETQETQTETTSASLPVLSQTEGMLLQVIAAMQEQMKESASAQAEANKALVEAIIESKKPYVDPKKAENEETMRRQDEEQRLRQKANIKYAQSACEHVAGGSALSEVPDLAGRTSIVWHRTDVQAEFGVCTTCNRIFTPNDEDYAFWRKKPSFNKLSASGFRQFRNPEKALNDSYLRDT